MGHIGPMTVPEILIIALALGVDAFAVGAAVGLRYRKPRQVFRLAFHFGLFQALMPLVGAFTGEALEMWIKPFDTWLAFGLLTFVGTKMIVASFSSDTGKTNNDPTRGIALVGLSTAVSIDALAVGFTLGLREVSILFAVSTIGIVAGLMTLFGMLGAGIIGTKIGKRGELVAGTVLVLLSVKILLENLT